MASEVSTHRGIGASRSSVEEKAEPARRPDLALPGRSNSLRRPRPRRRVLAVERWLLQRMLSRLGNPAVRVELWDARPIAAGGAPPVALVRIHDLRTLLGLFARPAIGFGEAYADGRIEVEGDLLELLESVSRAAWPARAPNRSLGLRRSQGLARLRANTLGRSRRNVHHHYDIREEFYRLWLDEQLVYTCAYFPDRAMGLEEAQRAKMDYVCRKLRLRPGESVVEAGFGWGALALHMARHYGVRVRAYNLSHEQTRYARRRAESEGLSSRVEFIEDDYRNVSGRFDAFVSVGMLEHVGRKHYRALGEVIDRCLKPQGRGLIHAIGRDRPAPVDAWIRQRIFPGAYAPTLREMMDVLEPNGFSVLDVENLRLHYAETLRHWLARYQTHEHRVAEMFDDRFARMWRLYLTGSIAGFTTGTLQLFQVVFARSGVNAIPATRAFLYEGP
jgi:cyclopropane-fatty-acyl-phospholipid synthase